MFRSGATLKRQLINGESSSSSAAKYFLFTFQNRNVVISKSRVTSIFYSFSTTISDNNKLTSSSDSSFVASYLVNSCRLSQNEAIASSKQVNFKTSCKPDSVLTLLTSYGFTEPQVSKLINKLPSILISKPHKTLKPKLDFFNSKGLYELDLANFILSCPRLLKRGLKKEIVPSFDILRSIVQSDQNVVTMIKRSCWILSASSVKRVMVNVELLRNEGIPQTNISQYLIQHPRVYAANVSRFKEIVEKVKEMGFNHLQTTFLKAVHGLVSISEATWRKKMNVYKSWGWSEDHIRTAFKKNPNCMEVSEKKIMAVINFLVNEMGYESLSIAEYPLVFNCSLKERIIPRCSVIRILVSRGLIKEKIAISTLSTIVDKSFLEKFVIKYEQEVPELRKIFHGQLSYKQLLQN